MPTRTSNHGTKIYSYPYPSISCIHSKSSDLNPNVLEFIEGKRYPFVSVSFETTGVINPSRCIQIVAEDGYKITFSGTEVEEYFDVTHVKWIVPKFI